VSDTELVLCLAVVVAAFVIGGHALLRREVRIYRRANGRR
jgi:hypothetical protein